ncbi:MAG: hypothetical protein LH654_07080 [Thermoleophilia bacterium]|nr:hypothetical protein [Thermoleophilia bacterium]
MAEAHAQDEWQLAPNLEEGVILTQQTTLEERREQALESASFLGLEMPLLIDEMDTAARGAFAAGPAGRGVVDDDGSLAYPGRPGPSGFSPEEARERLVALLDSATA